MSPSILANTLLLADASIKDTNNYSSDPKVTTNQTDAIPKNTEKSSKPEVSNSITKPQSYFQFTLKDIVWRNVIIFIYLHLAALYGTYLVLTNRARLITYIVAYLYGAIGAFGITAGAHRLWAHKAYKAKWQLRLLLATLNLIAFQNCIHEWVRDHRVHHKFVDTDADPHNARRGFFFSHMGWLLVRKHPDIKRRGVSVDMSDLEQDPIVMFQKRHYAWLMPLFSFVIPTLIPYYFLNEKLNYSWYVAGTVRYIFTLHCTWLVNSAAHIWGMRPYDKTIKPTNNKMVAVLAFGEGWHNYHHVFPWDYKTAELGDYSMNFTTAFIDFFAKIGWAYDLKTVSGDLISKRAARTGDGSTKYSNIVPKDEIQFDENNNELCDANKYEDEHSHSHPENPVWGWDDKDMDVEDKRQALITNKLLKQL